MGDASKVSDAVKVTDADVRAAAPQLAAAAKQAQKIKNGDYLTTQNPTGAAVNFGSSTGSANAASAQTANPTSGAQVSGNANAAVTNPVSQQVSGNANAANGTVSGNANAAYPNGYPNGYQGGYGSYSTTGSGATPTDVNYNNQISKTIAELETLYRDLYGRQREGDFTRTPYYQTIMDQYGIAGDNAANAERAAAAGNNGGNLDSYAAANARRQQLSYRNAAQTAALNAYNAEIGNMLQTLQSLGVNVNDLYGTWSGDLASQRSGANAAYGYDTQRYLSDNDYRAALAGYDRDRYLSDNDLTGTIYGSNTNRYISDNELLSDRYRSDNDLAGKMYGYDTDYDIAALQDATNRYGIDVNYLTSVLGYNTQAAIAQMDADAQMRVAQYQNLLGMYQADIQREIAQGNNASEERINAATLAYNQTRDALNNELQRYLGGLDYQASVANANATVDAARAKAGADGAATAPGNTVTLPGSTEMPGTPNTDPSIIYNRESIVRGGDTNDVSYGTAGYVPSNAEQKKAEPYVQRLAQYGSMSQNGLYSNEAIDYIASLGRYGLSDNLINWIVSEAGKRTLNLGEGNSPQHQKMSEPSSRYYATDLAGIEKYIQDVVDASARYGDKSPQYTAALNAIMSLQLPDGLAQQAILEARNRIYANSIVPAPSASNGGASGGSKDRYNMEKP